MWWARENEQVESSGGRGGRNVNVGSREILVKRATEGRASFSFSSRPRARARANVFLRINLSSPDDAPRDLDD